MSAHGTEESCRVEHDFLGSRSIPNSAYWGVHTARALENFPVSGIPLSRHRHLVSALGAVKQAAARVNGELGLLEPEVAGAIERACREVRDGDLDEQFVVDVIQGGAGTSTNMNANEVIANRALEFLQLPRGTYDSVHPNDHVNRCQSTNDVYPTAVKLALVSALNGLTDVLSLLTAALDVKAEEFAGVTKVGRTQLQDAVPMTVGQEFGAWSGAIKAEMMGIGRARAALQEVNLGGTAIGTGIASAPGYAERVVNSLSDISGQTMTAAPNLIAATSDTGSFVQLSGVLRGVALKVSKVCHDLRLLSSGPQAGFAELRLPPRQAGSSIMPGKVNPVIPEMVNQVAYAIVGNDATVAMAAEAGQLQLNAFEPVIAHRLLEGIEWLTTALHSLTINCVQGIDVNRRRLATTSAQSVGVVTALIPYLGYTTAARIAKAALAGEAEVRELVLRTGKLTSDELDVLLAPQHLTTAIRGRVELSRGPMRAVVATALETRDPHARRPVTPEGDTR